MNVKPLFIFAIRLVNSARDKLFEFENTTYEIAQPPGENVSGTTVVGMGDRLRTHRNEIKEVLGIEEKVKAVTVDLIERSELDQLRKEKEAPKNRTALDTPNSTNSRNNE